MLDQTVNGCTAARQNVVDAKVNFTGAANCCGVDEGRACHTVEAWMKEDNYL